MRELLDKEMPVVAGNTTNWRRMFGYAAGLVLLASASIGGYTAYTSFRDAETQLTAPTVAVNAPKPGGSNSSSTTAILAEPARENAGNEATTSNDASSPVGQRGNRSIAVTTGKPASNASENSANTTKRNISGKTISTVTVAKTTTNDNKKVATEKANTSGNKLNNSKETASTSTAASVPVAKQNTAATPANNGSATVAAGNNHTAATSAPTQEKTFASGNSTTTDNKKPGQTQLQNKPSASTSTSGGSASKNEVAKNDNLKKNMIDKVEERETYDRKTGAWKKDTIDKGKVEWKQQEELLVAKVDKPADNTSAAIVPAAAVEVKAEHDAEKLVALSDFRTSSKKGNYETRNIFEEMVKNAKLQLGGVRFYPGLVVGINTALSGKNSMTGFQVGVTGNLSLNEKWGIVSELKYVQRFKDGERESNRQEYPNKPQTINGGQYYQWDSVVSYFNYPTVSSVELPVMIKYSFNRFNMLAGANLAYYMGFTPDHKEFIYKKEGTIVPPPPPGAIMTSKDFGSRFGVGYLFGVGYQVSPAIQLDMRMTQSVWDNAASAGADRVSKEVFQLPSLQFNMSYRFSSNKYKPYRSQQ
jgi:hypothetical protein